MSHLMEKIMRRLVFRIFIALIAVLIAASTSVAQELYEAIRSGDLHYIQRHINAKPELANSYDGYDSIPLLQLACGYGHQKVVEYLLAMGADPSLGDVWGEQELDMCALATVADFPTNYRIAWALRPINVTATNRRAIHWAAACGRLPIVRLLLERGDSVDLRTGDQETPLMFAAKYGHVDVVEFLLARGADVRAKDVRGTTPLHAAATSEADRSIESVVDQLIRNGADVNAQDENGDTPLHVAAHKAAPDAVAALLGHGADISAQNYGEEEPIERVEIDYYAFRSRPLRVLRMLIKQGGDTSRLSSDQRDLLGQPWWYDLREYDRLSRGDSSLVIRDRSGATVVHYLAKTGMDHLLQQVLAKGLEINSRDTGGLTPLHLAASHGYSEIVHLLVSRGAKVNAADNAGWTPLHWAAGGPRNISSETTIALIKAGARVNIRDRKGKTPLTYAIEHKRDDIVAALRKHGGIE